MTMIAAVRTSTDVVLAADSKITTVARGGLNSDGSPEFKRKFYDQGTKIAITASGGLACATAGALGVGDSPMDYFRSLHLFSSLSGPDAEIQQEQELRDACQELCRRRGHDYKMLEPDPAQWLDMVIILTAHHPSRWCPRVWSAVYSGETCEFQEILQNPGVWMEGSPSDAMCLLYGVHYEQRIALGKGLGVEAQRVLDAAGSALRPLDKINFWAMPLQDAVDFAHFIVTVQVQMDRYVAGQDACGGPIDIAVVYGNPRKRVRLLPGKQLRHPGVNLEPVISDADGRMP